METNYSLANLGKEEKKTSAESRQSWSPYYRSRARDVRYSWQDDDDDDGVERSGEVIVRDKGGDTVDKGR